MPATDPQITATRRRLYSLIGQSYARIDRAARLLEAAAVAEPTSAQAQARKLIIEAKEDIENWTRQAGELVGVEFPA